MRIGVRVNLIDVARLRLGRTALRHGRNATAKRSGNLPLEVAVAERPAAIGRRPQVRGEIRVERGAKQRAIRFLAVGLGPVETPIEIVPADALAWNKDGLYFAEDRLDSRDLVAERKEQKRIGGWVNIYPKGKGFIVNNVIHSSPHAADKDAIKGRAARIEVDCLEGL